MGPWSNLNEHLLQTLNVICGRFAREGDRYEVPGILTSEPHPRAQVRNPRRTWESGFRSRLGYGMIGRELPTGILPDEILEPGSDQVRALVVVGANPACAIPEQEKAVQALSSLDLLVALEPFMTETAELADFVIAPSLQLERAECTGSLELLYFDAHYAQYSPRLLQPPPGVIEDWEFFFDLAAAMDLTLRIGSHTFEPGAEKPSTNELLDRFSTGRVPLADVKTHLHGHIYDELPPILVGAPGDGAGRFQLLPEDVAEELASAARGDRLAIPEDRPYLLSVRRDKRTLNSLGRRAPAFSSRQYNPCYLHPSDLSAEGLSVGDEVIIESSNGSVRAIVDEDDTFREGVASMTHCFGGLPGSEYRADELGTNPGRLLSLHDCETINAMPRITAIPVAIRRA